MNTEPTSRLYPRVSAMIDAVLNLEKGRTFQVSGQRIFPSEVHLLLDLARSPEATATDLAAAQGVTKGAISQTLTRLERKGLVIKSRNPDNRNALSLHLTPRGTETVAFFREKTDRLRGRVQDHLEALTPAERRTVAGFLDSLTSALRELGGEA